MATFNFTSSTNNANTVVYTHSTKIELRTDRDTSSNSKYAIVDSVANLGVEVAVGDPFTVLA
jgi:hypothetical protein